MKLGILGGTFNPIHNAHLTMATVARDALALDRVLLMVAADPPHKTVDNGVSAEERFFMTALAAQGLPRVEASDLELRRAGKSYMADTLLELHARYPGAELYLILGSDMLLDLPGWYHPERVLELSKVACMPRRGQAARDAAAAERLRRKFSARIVFLPGEAPALSSTEIRDRMEAGLPVEGRLPAAVERDCYEKGLYFAPDVRAMQAHLKGTLSEKRYRHTVGVVQTAARLAEDWDADAKRAQLAALLHDCAKQLNPVTLAVLGGDDTGILPVLHAFAGAVVARNVYGVRDEAVLRAIRLHSTGDAGMTLLEQLVYLADLIEPGRDFPGVEACRAAVADGPEAGMLFALRRSEEYIKRSGAFHPASVRALRYFEERANA